MLPFKFWVRRLFLKTSRSQRSPAARRHRGARVLRPLLEILEDRLAPATIVVTSLADNTTADGQVTLREAWQAAVTHTSVDGSATGTGNDTIRFAAGLAGGTITLTGNDLVNPFAFGPTALVVPNGTRITIDGSNFVGPGITLSGGGTHRVFGVLPGSTLTLQGITVTGGSVQGGDGGSGGTGGGGAAGLGGAVFNAGTLNVIASTFTGNTAIGGNGGNGVLAGGFGAAGGGGVGGAGGNAVAPFSGNAGGGGVQAAAPDTGTGNGGAGGLNQVGGSAAAQSNGTLGGGGGGGSAVFTTTAGSGTAASSGGFGGGGGGGFNGGAGGFGGGGGGGNPNGGIVGIGQGGQGGFGGGGGGSTAIISIGLSGFGGGAGGVRNGGGGAGMGGAIFNNGGVVTLTNSTLTGNTAHGGTGQGGIGGSLGGRGLGGALFNRNGSVTLLNSTLSGNTADGAGGTIYNLGDGAIGSVVMNNTIVAGTAPNSADFMSATLNGGISDTSGSNNLVQKNPALGGFIGTGTLTGQDPLLGSLADNGGPTQTLALGDTSPAIDAGTETLLVPTDPSVWTTDTNLQEHTGASVTFLKEAIQLEDRGYLNTASQYDPANGGLHITGTWTFQLINDDDFLQILTRSDGTPSGTYGETANGVQFFASASSGQVSIGGQGDAVVSGGDASALPDGISQGASFNFDIVDDGATLSFTLTQTDNLSNTVTVTATCPTHLGTNLVTFHNREFEFGGDHVALLQNVVIRNNTTSAILLQETPSSSLNLATDQRGGGYVRVYGAHADIGAFEVQTVTDTTTAVDASQGSVAYGTALTFTATVTASSGSDAPAQGGVEFYSGNTDLGAGTYQAGQSSGTSSVWTLTTAGNALPALSAQDVHAVYLPGPGFVTSTGTLSGGQTITKAHLTVTADNKARLEGQSDPTFTATLSGFVAGETLATSDVIVGAGAGFTSTDTAASMAGPYSITPSIGNLTSNNYDFSFMDGTLTVLKPLTNGKGIFTDADGDRFLVKLTGPGQVGVLPTGTGSIDTIFLAGTDPTMKSTLSITLQKPQVGDGLISIGDIEGSGLKDLNASSSNLVGGGINQDDGIHLTGLLKSLTLHDVLNGADIVVQGTFSDTTTLSLHKVDNGTTIDLGSRIASLTAASFGTGTVMAPSMGTLKITGDKAHGIAGDFGAVVNLSGQGVLTGRAFLNKVVIAGTVSGAIFKGPGNVKSFTVGAFDNSLIILGTYVPTDPNNLLAGGSLSSGFILGSFTAKGLPTGSAFVNSIIVAGTLTAVKLKSAQTQNGGVPFGVIGHTVVSVKIQTPQFSRDKKHPVTAKDDFLVKIV